PGPRSVIVVVPPRSPAAALRPSEPTTAALTPVAILVIDDGVNILEAVSYTLRLHGYRVATAKDGAEGLGVVEETAPRLVLLDMRMPGVDGWEFTRVGRARGIPAKIAIMTATTDIRRWADDVGAAG